MSGRPVDRRTFLRGVGAGGLVLWSACTPGRRRSSRPTTASTLPAGVDARSLPPAPRPEVRLGGAALGFPSPFGYGAGLGYRQMSLIYDTLLWKDATGRLIPWLASRVERSDDGLRYTFDLRDGVRWNDGQPLSADDVVFTFEYYAAKALGPLVVYQPYGVEKVTAPTPRRVEFRLERPNVTFPEYIAGTVPIAPRHVWSSVGDPASVQEPKTLVGSGPYRLRSYGGDSGPLAYEANDEYFLGRPFVRRVDMRPVSDELTALLAGDIDAAEASGIGTRPEALAPFRRDASFGTIEEPGGFTFPLYWNLARGGPLADVRFRQACALAIDRRDVVQRLTGGNGVPGNPGFLPPSNPFYARVEQYPFNRAAANRLLDGAGYSRSGGAGGGSGTRRRPDGRPLRFELLFPSNLAALAEVVAASLREVGVDIGLRGVELGPALYGTKLGGNYDMALTLYPGPSGPGPNADPDLLRPLFSSKAGNGLNSANGYVNAEFDDLAERQLKTFDEGERRKLVARMQEILARDLPALPLYYPTLFAVFRRPVFDQWYFTPGGVPVTIDNRQNFVTGVKAGTEIRPIR